MSKNIFYKAQLNIPKVPAGTKFVLFDPVEKYCLDHFGSEETLVEFWKNCWKPPRWWKKGKSRCIGLRFSGGKKPELLQIYLYEFWKFKYEHLELAKAQRDIGREVEKIDKKIEKSGDYRHLSAVKEGLEFALEKISK